MRALLTVFVAWTTCAGVLPASGTRLSSMEIGFPPTSLESLANFTTLSKFTSIERKDSLARVVGRDTAEISTLSDTKLVASASEPEKPSQTGTSSTEKPALPLGPCCDDFDCGPTSPLYINCSVALDCSVATCPLDPHKPIVGGRLISVLPSTQDTCRNRAEFGKTCACTCRCVCPYPTGEIVWLEWPILE